MMQGDDSYLRNADQKTKDFFRNELGVQPFKEGQTEISVASTGEVEEEFYKKGQEKQKELLEPVWGDIEAWMKSVRPGRVKEIQQLEQQALNPDFADPNQELLYIYDTKVNMTKDRVEQITSAKLNSDDPSRGGDQYTETWLKGFYNPETGKRYMFKEEVDAKDFWKDPAKYRGNMGDAIYIDDQGRGYQTYSTFDENEKKKYEQTVEKLSDARSKEMGLYQQYAGQQGYVQQAGASIAGGAAVRGKYLSGGRASMAGGMVVQPTKK